MGITTGTATMRASKYDIPRLAAGLRAEGIDLEYLEETTSTMDVAKDFGLSRTLVVADYQTAGRGRYGRDWLALQGRSVLMTYAEPWGFPGDPSVESILPPQVFANESCSALREVTGSPDIRLKWLNDFVAHGKKIGGVLLENVKYKNPDRLYVKLFGIGINVHYRNADEAFPDTDYGAISLDELACPRKFDRTDVVLAIAKHWSCARNDLRVMESNARVFAFHDERYQGNASLLGRNVRISGLGQNRDQIIAGRVLSSPLGRGLFIDVNGSETEITEYNFKTKVEVL